MGAHTARTTEVRDLRETAHAAQVRELTAAGVLEDQAWRAAFAAVPRHIFVPYFWTGRGAGHERLWAQDPDPEQRARWLRGVYADTPLATRLRDGQLVSSSSQPSLMAKMLRALEVRDGDNVLEIGAGTGYNAALLCHRLGDDLVTTVDLDEEITESARTHLAEVGYHPVVVTGDGARGCPSRAPFDRILVTCTLPMVPHAWTAQCRPGARILAPLSTGLIALTVRDADFAEGRFLHTPAYFVPLRGATAAPPRSRSPGCRTGSHTSWWRTSASSSCSCSPRASCTPGRPWTCGAARTGRPVSASGSPSAPRASGRGSTTPRARTCGPWGKRAAELRGRTSPGGW